MKSAYILYSQSGVDIIFLPVNARAQGNLGHG
jgi:hypothetical protein